MLRTNTISANGEIEYSLSTVQRNFKEFIRNYQTNSVFIYRDALLQSVRRGKNCLSISLSHLNEYDPMLLRYERGVVGVVGVVLTPIHDLTPHPPSLPSPPPALTASSWKPQPPSCPSSKPVLSMPSKPSN